MPVHAQYTRTELFGATQKALVFAAMIVGFSAQTANAATPNPEIDEINARYEQRYAQFKQEGDRLSERAPDGPTATLGVDGEIRMKEHVIIIDLPTVNMREKRIILDLPQLTMKDRRFSFTTIKSRMVLEKTGEYPETRCVDTWIPLPFGGKTKGVPKCTVTWSPIMTKVPEFWEDETDFVIKIPEFKMAETAIVMHLPDVEIAEQRIVLDLPEVLIKDVKVEVGRIQADAERLEQKTAATAAQHKAEIAAVVKRDMAAQRAQVANQFDVGISQLNSAINDLRAQGVDPANAGGTNLIAELSKLKQQKANALADLDRAMLEATS